MKRATSTPAGLNVKKITAYLKGQAKSRNAVRITCQSGSVYIITGYAAFKLPAILYRDVIQPVTMQDAPADGVTIVSSDAGFVVNDPHQLTAAATSSTPDTKPDALVGPHRTKRPYPTAQHSAGHITKHEKRFTP